DLDAADEDNDKHTILDIEKGIEKYHSELISDKQVQEKVEEVDKLLMNYKPVNDSELKYQKLDNDFATEYREALSSYEQALISIAESSDDDAIQDDFQQTADLL